MAVDEMIRPHRVGMIHLGVPVFSKWDRSRDLQHGGDKSLDLLSFPMKNPIFQQSNGNI